MKILVCGKGGCGKRDPSQESVRLAKKITEMAKAINKSFYYVLTK